jgi:hypothetical protein
MFAASKTSRVASGPTSDPFFDNVTTLLESSGTNGAQNNTFIDSSTNNFTITRNGNTTQGAFSPFGENWSNYFDGTGDYITAPANAAFQLTGDFTLEAWIYPTTVNSFNMVFGSENGANSDYMTIRATTLDLAIANAAYPSWSFSFTAGNWYHIAVTRSSTTLRAFVNGVALTLAGGSATNSSQMFQSGAGIAVGRYGNTSSPLNFTGYISNARIVKGTALYTANFTPSTVPLQPVQGTSLLTCRDSTIVDDSANLFTITRFGDVSVQKFGPFAATTLPTPYYSAYFDGAGDYLTLPSNQAQFSMGTGDFTIEMWVNVMSLSTERSLYDTLNQSDVTGTGRFAIRIQSNGTVNLFTGSGQEITSGGTLVVGTWYHIAYTRQSSSGRLYVNGVQVNTTNTDTRNYVIGNSNRPVIGVNGFDNSTGALLGYISNLRVVKGQALYTTNFTPSTVPLTTTSQGATASNVSLLTLQSTRFIDNSTNNFTLTAFGEPRPTAFAPFSVTYLSQQAYTPSVLGGSIYFDGNGDFLATPSSTAFGFGTGDFTVECWVYPTVNARQDWIDITNGIQRVLLYYSGSNIIFYSVAPNAAVITGPAMSLNVWTHLAISKRSGSSRLFVNGIQAGSTYTTNQDYAASAAVTIGKDSAGSTVVTGYMSNVRIVKGTGLYASNFVPQNTPLTAVTNTSLLLNATNAGIYDASTINNFETAGNAQVNTSIKIYGLSSVSFDGTGDCLITYNRLSSSFGTGSFTVEAWIYPTSVAADNSIAGGLGATNGDWMFGLRDANQLSWGRNHIGWDITTSGVSFAANTWYYVAVSRSGTTLRIFVNGIQRASATNTTAYNIGTALAVGARQATTNVFGPGVFFNGYIQDFRITNGIGRYTSNFTPPAAPLPDF